MEYRYIVDADGVRITEYLGCERVLNIPSKIDDTSVISIEKKAFMGNKTLVEVYVPSNVVCVGDYAFAQCTQLRKVVMEGNFPKMGRGVFSGCKRIENICKGSMTEDDMSFLIASVVSRLPALSLLTDDDIGSNFWVERYDLALRSFIARDDMEGYDDTALCGEEDISYDGIGSIDGELPGESETYVREACKNKCFLCLMRLMHSEGLERGTRLYLTNYITAHGFGLNNEAAWITIKEDLLYKPDYITLYLDTVKPGKEKVLSMLNDTDEKHALLKSLLIEYAHKTSKPNGVFESLKLHL